MSLSFVKRRVLEAALMSPLLYGCESWVGADLKPIVRLYSWPLKYLFGVRKSTPNDVCYAEVGYPSLSDRVNFKQHKFFSKVILERFELTGDLLMFSVGIATTSNTTLSRAIRKF